MLRGDLRSLGRCSLLLAVAALLHGSVVSGATITVTGTGDSIAADGVVTLREAITSITFAVNVNSDVVAVGPYGTNDTINFNIPGPGVHTITPTSTLTLGVPMTINGLSQPGASPNTLTVGDNAVLLIRIDGTNTGAGLAIGDHTGSVVRGLVIGKTPSQGSGILIYGAGGGHQITSCFIGTDATGMVAEGNHFGGITINDPSSNNTIGGTTPDARNVISGNAIAGVGIQSVDGGSTSGNVVKGNYIGVASDGVTPLGNTAGSQEGWGVLLTRNISNNTIGGTTAGSANIIAFNAGPGVAVFGTSATNNGILGNSIYSNGGLGIDLGDDGPTSNDPCDADTGPNNLQNFPILTTAFSGAGSTTIQGTLNSGSNTTYRIEFFSNAVCDPAGFGEGQTFLGFTNTTTNSSCNASFNVTLPVSVASTTRLTATATDPGNNTSEFSSCISLSAQFHTVPPCRVADTRGTPGPYGGPALNTTSDRSFVITGQCGIPVTAQAVAFNFAIVQPTAGGHVTVYPGGGALPASSTMNYSAGQIRANNAIVPLGPSGNVLVHLGQGAGTTSNLIIDVNGYFQ